MENYDEILRPKHPFRLQIGRISGDDTGKKNYDPCIFFQGLPSSPSLPTGQ